MKDLIQKYGKQLTKELLDLIIISRKINNEQLRLILIKYGVIKKSTKSIRINLTRYQRNNRSSNGVWTTVNDWSNSLSVRNGKGQTILPYISFYDSEIPAILEVLNDEIDTHHE